MHFREPHILHQFFRIEDDWAQQAQGVEDLCDLGQYISFRQFFNDFNRMGGVAYLIVVYAPCYAEGFQRSVSVQDHTRV